MICWILKKDLESYKQLCSQSGITPVILEEDDDKLLVEMTSGMMNTWVSVGYWFG